MSGGEDDDSHECFRTSASPHERWVLAILTALEASDGMAMGQLEEELNLRRGQIEQVLKFLAVDSPLPVIRDGSRWRRTPIGFQTDWKRIQRIIERRVQERGEAKRCISHDG